MIKKLTLVFATLLLTSCSPSTTITTHTFIMPADLAHCSIIKMAQGGGDRIYLIKCPPGTVPDGYIGTTTGQTQGKTSVSVGAMIL